MSKRKAMTWRQLMWRLRREANKCSASVFDMTVCIRVEDEDGEHHVGGLYDIGVDAGCGDVEMLILDAAPDAIDPNGSAS